MCVLHDPATKRAGSQRAFSRNPWRDSPLALGRVVLGLIRASFADSDDAFQTRRSWVVGAFALRFVPLCAASGHVRAVIQHFLRREKACKRSGERFNTVPKSVPKIVLKIVLNSSLFEITIF